MAWQGQSVLAVVPARGGSKGIPRKNLQTVGGLTLLERVAATRRELPWIDHALLSTEDDEIAEAGRRAGLEVPFPRPPELAGDAASSIDVWQHAWRGAEAHWDMRFELSVLLEPTSPLRRADDVERVVRTLVEGGHRAAVSVTRAPSHLTPERALRVDADGTLGPYDLAGPVQRPRQTIPDSYFRNGVCYAVTRERLLDEGAIFGDDTVAVVVERQVVNVDEPFDLELAEFLLSRP